MRKMMIILCLAAIAVPTAARAMDESLMITGYVDGEFQATQIPDTSPGAAAGATTWKTSFGDASHAVFWATGAPSENVDFATEVYYYQSTNTLTLNQAVADWKVAGDQFGIQFGKFYFPFGIEARSRYATTNRLVSQPMLMAWTDNGIGLHGMMKSGEDMSWSWNVAVTNGRSGVGLASQTTDANNNNKSVGGRIEVMPMGDMLNIGGSAAFGAWDLAGDNNYILAGGHVIADPVEHLDLRGEFYWQQLSDVAPTTTTPDVKAMAFYGQGAYRYPVEGWNYIEPVARFAWMDPNTDVDNDGFSQVAVGLDFSPVEHFVLKGEFDVNMEQGTSVDNNMFRFQGVYGW
jgi:hypothetical protein